MSLYEGKKAPIITLEIRKPDLKVKGDNKYSWGKLKTRDIYKNKRIIIFALPGAYPDQFIFIEDSTAYQDFD